MIDNNASPARPSRLAMVAAYAAAAAIGLTAFAAVAADPPANPDLKAKAATINQKAVPATTTSTPAAKGAEVKAEGAHDGVKAEGAHDGVKAEGAHDTHAAGH